MLPVLVREGLLDEKTAAAFLYDWRERSTNPEALFFGSPVMEIIGVLKK